jgi:hypothetical protein
MTIAEASAIRAVKLMFHLFLDSRPERGQEEKLAKGTGLRGL